MKRRFPPGYGILAGLVGLSLIIPSAKLRAEDEADLLALLRAGHRSARQSIRTLSCTVTSDIKLRRQELLLTGKYWRSFKLVRIHENWPNGSMEDYLLRDSVIRQVGRHRQPRIDQYHYSAVRQATTEVIPMCDVWTVMLLDFPRPGGGTCDFDQFLEYAKRPVEVRREQVEGRDCIRLTMHADSTPTLEKHVTLWHDVGRNYLVWKKSVTSGRDSNLTEEEILQFDESVSGVFFPTKCRQQTHRGRDLISGRLMTLSDVRINQPIPESAFQMPGIPRGTVVYDFIQRTQYPIDENWQAIGPTKPLAKYVVAAPAPVEGGFTSQSTEEPQSWTRWLVPGALAVLLVAAGCWLYRRYWPH